MVNSVAPLPTEADLQEQGLIPAGNNSDATANSASRFNVVRSFHRLSDLN